MFCRFCGKEIPNDSKFCQFCGSLLDCPEKEDNDKHSPIECVVSNDSQEPFRIEISKPSKRKSKFNIRSFINKHKALIAKEIVYNIKLLKIAILLLILYSLFFYIQNAYEIKSPLNRSSFQSSKYDDYDTRDWRRNIEHNSLPERTYQSLRHMYYDSLCNNAKYKVTGYYMQQLEIVRDPITGEIVRDSITGMFLKRKVGLGKYCEPTESQYQEMNELIISDLQLTDKDVYKTDSIAKDMIYWAEKQASSEIHRMRLKNFFMDLGKHLLYASWICWLTTILGRYLILLIKNNLIPFVKWVKRHSKTM